MSGRIRRAAGFTLAAGLLAAASGRAAEPLAPLLGCRSLTDASARLECFDRESAKLSKIQAAAEQSPSLPPAADRAPAVPASRPAVDPLKSFGLPEEQIAAQEVAAGARPADLSSIDARVSAVLLAATGQATFKLDNGQVWRELGADGDLFAKPGDSVAISRGVFHSYWLQLKNGRGCKVRRVL